MEHFPSIEQRPRRDPTLFAFLSLYLLLLAFFILLNSLSQTKEERMQAALGSIDVTFKYEFETPLPPRPEKNNPGDPVGPDSFQAELHEVFEGALPVGRYRILEKGNLIEVAVPADLIFVPGRAKLRSPRRGLMQNLAAGLANPSDGGRYEIEFQIGAGAALPNVDQAAGSLGVLRAGAFARDLRRRGVPGRLIGSGIVTGNPNQVRLTFHRRPLQLGQRFGRDLR